MYSKRIRASLSLLLNKLDSSLIGSLADAVRRKSCCEQRRCSHVKRLMSLSAGDTNPGGGGRGGGGGGDDGGGAGGTRS